MLFRSDDLLRLALGVPLRLLLDLAKRVRGVGPGRVEERLLELALRLLGGEPRELLESLAGLFTAAGSWAIGIGTLALLFRWLPYADVSWRSVVIGATITAALVALGTVAILIKQELLLILVGGLFVLEVLSVILQVGSFKLRGRRIFRMAPLHHHYELSGWKETQVVVRFWIITMLLCLVGMSTLKLR